MGSNINRETSQEQSAEDEVRLVVTWEEGQHPVHQMQGFLVASKRKRHQSLELLIIVQGVESDQSLSENLVRMASRRSLDKVQDLRGNFLG